LFDAPIGKDKIISLLIISYSSFIILILSFSWVRNRIAKSLACNPLRLLVTPTFYFSYSSFIILIHCFSWVRNRIAKSLAPNPLPLLVTPTFYFLMSMTLILCDLLLLLSHFLCDCHLSLVHFSLRRSQLQSLFFFRQPLSLPSQNLWRMKIGIFQWIQFAIAIAFQYQLIPLLCSFGVMFLLVFPSF